jgi:hypothetical protein
MNRTWLWLGFACACGGALAAVACEEQSSLPGTDLGTFSVSATVSSNSCGTSLGAPDPWLFDAKMSKDGTTLYWQQDQADAVSGQLDSTGTQATIAVTSTNQSDGGIGGCTIARTDTLNVVVGDAGAPTAISGSVGFAFSASSTVDCAAELSANGGSYQTLPCELDYTFTGTKQ